MKTILFQGDSITDVGRKYRIEQPNKPRALGNGYVKRIVAKLLDQTPENSLAFILF